MADIRTVIKTVSIVTCATLRLVRGVVVLLVALVALVLAASSAAEAAGMRATLRLTDSTPLTVRGIHFKPRERVQVTFTVGVKKLTRTVRATRFGRFSASTGEDVRLDRCGDFFLVMAIGSRGSRASLKYPLPDCPPQP
jgi:hypothetical protein